MGDDHRAGEVGEGAPQIGPALHRANSRQVPHLAVQVGCEPALQMAYVFALGPGHHARLLKPDRAGLLDDAVRVEYGSAQPAGRALSSAAAPASASSSSILRMNSPSCMLVTITVPDSK